VLQYDAAQARGVLVYSARLFLASVGSEAVIRFWFQDRGNSLLNEVFVCLCVLDSGRSLCIIGLLFS
jgi:hypothetical protein